jgi:hypothetical protein
MMRSAHGFSLEHEWCQPQPVTRSGAPYLRRETAVSVPSCRTMRRIAMTVSSNTNRDRLGTIHSIARVGTSAPSACTTACSEFKSPATRCPSPACALNQALSTRFQKRPQLETSRTRSTTLTRLGPPVLMPQCASSYPDQLPSRLRNLLHNHIRGRVLREHSTCLVARSESHDGHGNLLGR